MTLKRIIRDALRHRAQLEEQRRWLRTEWAVEAEIERAVSSDRTLVVGPWLSEVGYEALYWVPFLRWVMAAFRLDPGRVVAVSRGGVSSWYAGIASRYIEIWDECAPAEFAARTAERGAAKQVEISAFDREVLDAVRRRLGCDLDVLHPSVMYKLFGLFWSGQRAMSFLDSHTRFARIQPPQVIDLARLPRQYVAVKFYSARSLPDTADVRRAVASLTAGIADQTPVVLLDSGLTLDEHVDYDLARSGRVLSAREWMTPRDNLAVQTQIIAGARAFVGTCGSVAWLAPMLGVDTSAVFVDPKWLHVHLGVALRATHKTPGAGRFAALDLRALDPVGLMAAVGS